MSSLVDRVYAREVKGDGLDSLRRSAGAPRPATPAMIPEPIEVPRGAGVYVLLDNARVVWIGQSRFPIQCLHAHDMHRPGDIRLPGLPAKPVKYNRILLYPTTVDSLGEVYRQLCEAHSWRNPS